MSDGYAYKSQLTPVITEVSPRRGGTAGGTRLTISGSGFRCSKGAEAIQETRLWFTSRRLSLLSLG